MHLNYYFLSQVARTLKDRLQGARVLEIFSQSKDELLIQFKPVNATLEVPEFTIRAALNSTITCLTFPSTIYRAKKNSIDLFRELIELKVLNVSQYENERAFCLHLESGFQLVFKMFGNRSNILLFKNGVFRSMFNNRLQSDSTLVLPLDRSLKVSFSDFIPYPDISKHFPTLGKIVKFYLEQKDYQQRKIEEKWKMIHETISSLENPASFYLIKLNNSFHLSLLPVGEVFDSYNDPLQACNQFYRHYTEDITFRSEQSKLLNTHKKQIAKSANFIQKSEDKLTKLLIGSNYKQIGDILMANLHQIKPHEETVRLHNFYTQKEISIKLKPGISPQKNAETYYRKSKNQHLEIANLEKNIASRKKILNDLNTSLDRIAECTDLKSLKAFLKENRGTSGSKKAAAGPSEPLPFMERRIGDFKILIGKNAKSNDKMLNTYSHKEDMWLHVKDAPGSHVLIKFRSGNPYPKPTLERAAQMAAYYSKRRSETVVPVSYTIRKYVRKRKGDPPGTVIIEKEKVLLVEPAK